MRREAIEKHRRQRAGRVLAVLPVHYPKPLLTAMNVLAVELWGPPGRPLGVQAGRVQPYICPVVRNALAFLSHGPAELVDGVLFANTCDSIQGLSTLLPDLGEWKKATLRFWYPVGPRRPSAQRFLEAEFQRFAGQLEQLTQMTLDPQKLTWAIQLHHQIDTARAELLERRAFLDLPDRQLYGLLREGEYLWPEDHLVHLRQAQERLADAPVQQGVPVMVSGLVPEPMALLEVLYQAGAFVAGDDYAGIGRRIVRQAPDGSADPWTNLVEWTFAHPPCSLRGGPFAQRLEYLEQNYQRSRSAGLIIHAIKFCEPEIFDVPGIKKAFLARQRPVLYLETEMEQDLAGQHVTRLEAFVEMITRARRAA